MDTPTTVPYEGVTIFRTAQEAVAYMDKTSKPAIPFDAAMSIIAINTTRYPALLEALQQYKETSTEPHEIPPVHYALFDFKGYRVTVTKDGAVYRVMDTTPPPGDDYGPSCTCTVWSETLDKALARFHGIVYAILAIKT